VTTLCRISEHISNHSVNTPLEKPLYTTGNEIQRTAWVKLDAHGMRPMCFLSACIWFRDVTSFSDVSGMVCVRVGTYFYIDASDLLLWLPSRNQTHAPEKRVRRMLCASSLTNGVNDFANCYQVFCGRLRHDCWIYLMDIHQEMKKEEGTLAAISVSLLSQPISHSCL